MSNENPYTRLKRACLKWAQSVYSPEKIQIIVEMIWKNLEPEPVVRRHRFSEDKIIMRLRGIFLDRLIQIGFISHSSALPMTPVALVMDFNHVVPLRSAPSVISPFKSDIS